MATRTMSVQEAVARNRAALIAREHKAVVRLGRALSIAERELAQSWAELHAEVEARRASGETITRGMLIRLDRYHTLIGQVHEEVDRIMGIAGAETVEIISDAYHSGATDAHQLVGMGVERSATLSGSFTQVSFNAVEAMAATALQPGSPVYDLLHSRLAETGELAAKRAGHVLTSGIVRGENPRVTGAELARTLGMSRDRGVLIARSEQMRAYRGAQTAQYIAAGPDVVENWIWGASIDARTCVICIAENGTEHPLTETLDSHPGCRCVQIPGVPGVPVGSNGLPYNMKTGDEAFKGLSPEAQRAKLGPAKYDAYQRGDITLGDLVARTRSKRWGPGLRAKTLQELDLKAT